MAGGKLLPNEQPDRDMILYPDFGHEGLPEANDRIWEFMAGS
jgi:hypothetical protein